MSIRIFKYNITDNPTQLIPFGSKILSAQYQSYKIYVWALVDEDQEPEEYCFSIVPTGMEIDNDMNKFHFIDTVQTVGGFVFHIFVNKI